MRASCVISDQNGGTCSALHPRAEFIPPYAGYVIHFFFLGNTIFTL